MSIVEFLNKWAPDEPEKDYEFQDDFWATLNTTTGQHNVTAIQALTNIPGAELILDTREDAGRIAFGLKDKSRETGIILYYSLAVGQSEQDWLCLLKCIAGRALKQMK